MIEMAEERHGGVTVLAVSGRIDSNSAKAFEEQLSSLFRAGRNRVVVDFTKIAYISSAGCRGLLVAGRLADKVKGALALCAMSTEVRRVFDLGGLADLFTIYASREEGLEKIAIA